MFTLQSEKGIGKLSTGLLECRLPLSTQALAHGLRSICIKFSRFQIIKVTVSSNYEVEQEYIRLSKLGPNT